MTLIGKRYAEAADVLYSLGYVPCGRYEHTRKGHATDVAFLWEPRVGGVLGTVVMATVDNSGNADTVTRVFTESPNL